MKKQSNVPQIRFQNFEELWKDDKLKKCLKEVKKMPKDEVKKQFKKSWNKFKGKKYKEVKFENE